MATSYEDAKQQMQTLKDTLESAQQNLQTTFSKYKVTSPNLGSIRNLNREDSARDQDFWEEKQNYGDEGVSTQLNLQALILYVFIGSLAFLGVALGVHQFVQTQSVGEALKILGIYAFFVFILFALVLRYA